MPQMNAIINVTRRDKLKNGKLVFIIARLHVRIFSRQRRAALTVHPPPLHSIFGKYHPTAQRTQVGSR
jgi:hypothetical protein